MPNTVTQTTIRGGGSDKRIIRSIHVLTLMVLLQVGVWVLLQI